MNEEHNGAAERPVEIPFMDGFCVSVNPTYQSDNMIDDALSSIGVLISLAQDCSNLAAVINDGGTPSAHMAKQAAYAASVLCGLANGVSITLKSIAEP